MRVARRLFTVSCFGLLGVCGFGLATAHGDETTPKTGDELLDRVEATLRGLPGASFDVDGSVKIEAPGVDNTSKSTYAVRFERPRRWAIEMTTGDMGGASVSNGEELTTYFSMTKRYTVQPMPEEWDPSRPNEGAESLEWRVAEVARRLMGYDLKSIVMGVAGASSVKDDELDGKPCWLGEFKIGPSTYHVWVSADKQPLIQRVIATSEEQAGGAGDAKAMTVTTTVSLDVKNWNTNPKFTDADFAFTPPKGAEQGESLFEGMGGQPEIHPLVGEPAPKFEVDALDGKAFKLGDALKKQVIMLDFWATWCGPCVAALPEVAAAAKATKDKGVVFYAVNLQETPEQVREFLAEHKLDVPVLLDAEGQVAQEYQVSGIPQTVLIGKDGRVHVVHVGFGGDAKSTLIKQLTALAEGKDLANETLGKRDKQADDEKAEEAPDGDE